MLLGEMLHAGAVTTQLQARDKHAAIAELVELSIKAGDIPRAYRDHVIEIVTARETSGSTGMEHGIAVPHATSDRLQGIAATLGVSAQGIDWGCLDCEPARLIILLVMPRRKFRVHVRALAGISHLLNNDAFCDSLLAATNADEILRLIQAEERDTLFDAYRSLRE